jgi:hypothetical protein
MQAEADVQQAQQQATTDANVRKLQMQQEANTTQAELNAQKRLLEQRALSHEKKLSELDNTLYTKLRADRDKFIVDSEKNKYMNEQMLLEYKLRTAKGQADFENYMNESRRLGEQKLNMMEIINKKMQAQIEWEAASERSKLDTEHMKAMYQIQQLWEKKIAEEKKKQAKRGGLHGMINAVGTGLLSTGHPYAMIAGGAILAVENIGADEEGGLISKSVGPAIGS